MQWKQSWICKAKRARRKDARWRRGPELAHESGSYRRLLAILLFCAVPLAARPADVDFKLVTPTDPEADGNPPALHFTDGAYDPVRGKLIIYGGKQNVGGARHNKIWEFDGASWDDAGTFAALEEVASAYDTVNSIMLHAYGSNTGSPVHDVRSWNGVSLTNLSITDPEGDGNPGGRSGTPVVFDANLNRMVSFGGQPAVYANDTWSWTGSSWDLLIPTDPEGDGEPAARTNHAFGFDLARNRACVFGGYGTGSALISESSAVWEWDGVSWERVIPTDPESDGSPGARSGARFVYHPGFGRLILVGGNDFSVDLQEVWDWNGTSWRKHTVVDALADGNADCAYASAVFMANIGKIVLYGHAGSNGDRTWTLEFSAVPVELSGFAVE